MAYYIDGSDEEDVDYLSDEPLQLEEDDDEVEYQPFSERTMRKKERERHEVVVPPPSKNNKKKSSSVSNNKRYFI